MARIKQIELSSSKTVDKEQTWKQLVADNLDFAYQVARRFLTADADIQDAIQAAFVKAWKSFQQYDASQSLFTTWFYSILRNTCIDMQRQLARRNKKQVKALADDLEHSQDENPENQLENREIYQTILIMAEDLPLKQKECFLLRDIQGYTIKEIADITLQSAGSVKTSVYLARKKLKQWIIERKLI